MRWRPAAVVFSFLFSIRWPFLQNVGPAVVAFTRSLTNPAKGRSEIPRIQTQAPFLATANRKEGLDHALLSINYSFRTSRKRLLHHTKPIVGFQTSTSLPELTRPAGTPPFQDPLISRPVVVIISLCCHCQSGAHWLPFPQSSANHFPLLARQGVADEQFITC